MSGVGAARTPLAQAKRSTMNTSRQSDGARGHLGCADPEPADHHNVGTAAAGVLLGRQGRLGEPDTGQDGEVEVGWNRPGEGAHGRPPPPGEDRAAPAPWAEDPPGSSAHASSAGRSTRRKPLTATTAPGGSPFAFGERLLHRCHGQAAERDRGRGVLRGRHDHGAGGRGRGREGRGVGRVGDLRRGWRRWLGSRAEQPGADHGPQQHDRQDESRQAQGAAERRPRAGGRRLDDHRVPLPTSEAARRMHGRCR